MATLLLVFIYIFYIGLGLPDSLLGRAYYRPAGKGQEAALKERLQEIKEWKELHKKGL